MRILIVRLSAMGDIIHAMPAVSALGRHWPEAHIGWAVEERWLPLLSSCSRELLGKDVRRPEQPLAHTVHLISFKQWRRNLFSATTRKSFAEVRRALKAADYDAAIDLQGAVRSAILAKMSGAGEIIGEAQPREYPARWWFTKKIETRGEHVIEQAHDVICGFVGRRLPIAGTEFPRDAAAEQWSEQFGRNNRYAILNPGAGWGAKCWPAERYGGVARELTKRGIRSLVNVGPGEAGLGADVVAASQGTAEMVECSLAQLIALMRSASLFIGGDTGPMHLASAMQVPVVGIFGPTDPRRNGPFNSPNIVLRRPQSRRDHSRRSEPEEGLLSITTEEVVRAALELIKY